MDIYDQQIALLRAAPDEMVDLWASATGLFKFIGNVKDNRQRCGCLTLIKMDIGYSAYINGIRDEALTNQIKADPRLPNSSDKITVESLPVFAEWQRRIDALNAANDGNQGEGGN